MDRKQHINDCFQRGQQLTLAHEVYRACVADLFRWMMHNDAAQEDVTTKLLKLDRHAKVVIHSRQAGVVAGIEETLFALDNHAVTGVTRHREDGDAVAKNAPILSFTAPINLVLSLERTLLNVIGRMSGIATQTHRLARLAQQIPEGPQIAGTRKTPWMLLDKRAIYCGGGLTHRLSLADSILIKDNHLVSLQHRIGNITTEQAIQSAVELVVASSARQFELEVESLPHARAALSRFRELTAPLSDRPMMIIMLDNLSLVESQALIDEVRHSPLYDQVLFEASGDITEEALPGWLQTGVDVLSMGALTHSVKVFNVSMTMTEAMTESSLVHNG
ncbi:MAG TPA: hypothetical protein VMT34_16250 [Aggregatilineales bacterium]|nr:hypothetical protein [Aggregatilineales bacterium]